LNECVANVEKYSVVRTEVLGENYYTEWEVEALNECGATVE
jgi:hypothetical protein